MSINELWYLFIFAFGLVDSSASKVFSPEVGPFQRVFGGLLFFVIPLVALATWGTWGIYNLMRAKASEAEDPRLAWIMVLTLLLIGAPALTMLTDSAIGGLSDDQRASDRYELRRHRA